MSPYFCRKQRLFTSMLLVMLVSIAGTSFAQTSAPPSFTFETASIKPNKSGSSSSNSNTKNGFFISTNTTVKNLIQYQAFGISGARIFGGPAWLNTARFDIEAKADGATVSELQKLSAKEKRTQTQSMFQQLLADRFQLATHWETRELPVYALVIAKKGALLQPSNDPAEKGASTSTSSNRFTGQNVTLSDFAQTLTDLSRELGRVVVDKTGTEGRFNITLKWNPDSGDSHANKAPSDADTPPDIFTAIQEQLGLKLESSKAPVQVLVIDRLEMPSEN